MRGLSNLFMIMLMISMLLAQTHNARDADSCKYRFTAMWDPNAESDLAGYKVYAGNESGSYYKIEDVGKDTLYEFWMPDSLVYVVVTAYDESGNESFPSEEVAALDGDLTKDLKYTGADVTEWIRIWSINSDSLILDINNDYKVTGADLVELIRRAHLMTDFDIRYIEGE